MADITNPSTNTLNGAPFNGWTGPSISQITLPNGTTYNIKDAQARDMIETIQSALIFVGVTTTKLTDGATANPILINGEEYLAENGDIVIYKNDETAKVPSKSKEFVAVGAGTAITWYEFGDMSNLGGFAYVNSGVTESFTVSGTITSGDTYYVIADDATQKVVTGITNWGSVTVNGLSGTFNSNEIVSTISGTHFATDVTGVKGSIASGTVVTSVSGEKENVESEGGYTPTGAISGTPSFTDDIEISVSGTPTGNINFENGAITSTGVNVTITGTVEGDLVTYVNGIEGKNAFTALTNATNVEVKTSGETPSAVSGNPVIYAATVADGSEVLVFSLGQVAFNAQTASTFGNFGATTASTYGLTSASESISATGTTETVVKAIETSKVKFSGTSFDSTGTIEKETLNGKLSTGSLGFEGDIATIKVSATTPVVTAVTSGKEAVINSINVGTITVDLTDKLSVLTATGEDSTITVDNIGKTDAISVAAGSLAETTLNYTNKGKFTQTTKDITFTSTEHQGLIVTPKQNA